MPAGGRAVTVEAVDSIGRSTRRFLVVELSGFVGCFREGQWLCRRVIPRDRGGDGPKWLSRVVLWLLSGSQRLLSRRFYGPAAEGSLGW